MFIFRHVLRSSCLLVLWLSLTLSASAADNASIHGTVTDPLGAVVANAKVELLQSGEVFASVASNEEGDYHLPLIAGKRCQIRVAAPAFQPTLIDVPYSADPADLRLNILLSLAGHPEQVTVTATGTPVPEAQVGVAITILTPAEYPLTQDVHDALRLVPGLQVTRQGQQGGKASLFIRGGQSVFNKVLVDGVPASDIGGEMDFAILALNGIDRIEILRSPNSALYGADALAGVVSLNTARGSTPLPQITYRVGGGNFGTLDQEATIGGAYKQLDYFSDFQRLDTRNSVPNSLFHNATYAGNFGWRPLTTTSLRGTLRRLAIADGNPNAIQLFGIPDDSTQKNQSTLLGITLENQTTEHWHNLLRYTAQRLNGEFTNLSATGIPFESIFGTIYLGAPVTIRGANGYTVSGQAQFEFAGTYPNLFRNSAGRDIVYGQSDYRLNLHTAGLVAFKYEHERGSTTPTDFPGSSVDRANYSTTVEVNGDLRNRLHYIVGTGIEKNAVFGLEATPRLALAYYLVRPGGSNWLSGTKLRFSFSNGIKEPNIFNQTNSVYGVLAQLPNGPQLISQYHISPIGSERSRSFDGGIDQQLFSGRGRLGLTYFHNKFRDGIEFVPQQALVTLGVPEPIAEQTPFGATINSQTVRAQGAELELEYKFGNNLMARGGYTYLGAVVQRSFSSDTLFPSINPAFPTIPIGAFSPLKGARPFRRAPHSGYFGIYYNRSRWLLSMTGTLVGKRDDSDFLFDQDFGPTLLLPNRNLDAGYQRLDVTGSYRVSHALSLYSSFQNILGQHYSEAFGFPSLPFTFRSGIKIILGGESWKLK